LANDSLSTPTFFATFSTVVAVSDDELLLNKLAINLIGASIKFANNTKIAAILDVIIFNGPLLSSLLLDEVDAYNALPLIDLPNNSLPLVDLILIGR
jgi:hypothetical protein